MLYLVRSGSHHNSERPELRVIIEAGPENIELEALKRVFDFDFGWIGAVNLEELEKAYAKVKARSKKGREVSFRVTDEEGQQYRFVLWRYPPGTDESGTNKDLNLGFGQSRDGTSNGTDKSENRWVHFEPWQRNQKRFQELLKQSKEELADLICRWEIVG
jgi:hypothetical protein